MIGSHVAQARARDPGNTGTSGCALRHRGSWNDPETCACSGREDRPAAIRSSSTVSFEEWPEKTLRTRQRQNCAALLSTLLPRGPCVTRTSACPPRGYALLTARHSVRFPLPAAGLVERVSAEFPETATPCCARKKARRGKAASFSAKICMWCNLHKDDAGASRRLWLSSAVTSSSFSGMC